MTSDSGSTRRDTDYALHIQEALHELDQLQQTPRLVTSPADLEALEREIRQRTDRLGSLLVGHHLQQALDSAALQAEQEQLVHQWPTPLKNDGRVKVGIRTAQGVVVSVWVTYYRRKGQRHAGKRDAGVYAGLVLLGIYDRLSLSRLNVKCRQNLGIRYYGANVVTSCLLECQKPGELKSR